jgi:hypothetical protein
MHQLTTSRPPHETDDVACSTTCGNDFVRWLESQARWHRAKKFELLDLEDFADEIAAMGIRERRELRSRFKLALVHRMKCAYQPDRDPHAWLGTLSEQRDEIAELKTALASTAS